MPARHAPLDDPDPVWRALDLIGHKWSLLIIRDAFAGLSRFNEFRASLGIPKASLAARLRVLTQHGILQNLPISDDSNRRAYSLTDRGQALAGVIVALNAWSDTYL